MLLVTESKHLTTCHIQVMTFGQVVLPTLFSIHECESDLHSNEH